MSSPNAAGGEVRELVEALCDGTLTPAGRSKLVALLRRDPAARQLYRDFFRLDTLLLWDGRGPVDRPGRAAAKPQANRSLPAIPANEPSAMVPPAAGPLQSPRSSFLGDLVRWLPGGEFTVGSLLLIAVVGAFAGLAMILARRSSGERDVAVDRTSAPVAARLTASAGCRWRSAPPQADRTAQGRRLEIGEGVAEFTFAEGARIVVEGPAAFEILSPARIWLEQGRLAAIVPPHAIGFTVAPPSAEVIDLGTEFGVDVDGGGKTEIHVLKGQVAVKDATTLPATTLPAKAAEITKVVAGQAVRVAAAGERPTRITVDRRAFAKISQTAGNAGEIGSDAQSIRVIRLGNLFDDPPGTSLVEALGSDTFKASPTFRNTLGVERLIYGGPALLEVAPGIRFDLTSLGWTGAVTLHRIANDAWSHNERYVRNGEPAGGVRLSGQTMSLEEPKMEDAIGMHADALLTFDLERIRSAGGLDGRAFEFVCDRAGVNDTSVEQESQGSVHLVAIVSLRDAPQIAWVDGAVAELDKRAGNWFISSPVGKPLQADGQTVAFRIPIPPAARFLTLVVSGTSDGVAWDHAVWLGARLEVIGGPGANEPRRGRLD